MNVKIVFGIALFFCNSLVSMEQQIIFAENQIDNNNNEFFIAARDNDVAAVQGFILSGKYNANTITNNKYRCPILHYTTLYGTVDCMHVLINHGANINASLPVGVLHAGSTPLHLAVTKRDMEKVQLLLLNKQINVNATDAIGDTALQTCICDPIETAMPIIALLLRYNTNVNSENKLGCTALHKSLTHDLRIMESLLICKANTTILDCWGKSVFHLAAEIAHLDAIRLLLRYGANPLQKTGDGKTVLSLVSTLDEKKYPSKNEVIVALEQVVPTYYF